MAVEAVTLPDCGSRCVVCTVEAARPALAPREPAPWRHASGLGLCWEDALAFITWDADGRPDPDNFPVFVAVAAAVDAD